MAAGWSPAGEWGLTTSKWPPARTIASTGRYSECATTGCSVANAMLPRVEPGTDTCRDHNCRWSNSRRGDDLVDHPLHDASRIRAGQPEHQMGETGFDTANDPVPA